MMKKISVIFLIIILSCLVLFLSGILILGINNGPKFSFTIATKTKLIKEERLTSKSININADTANVNFYYHDDDEILVEIYGYEKNSENISIEELSDKYIINYKNNNRYMIGLYFGSEDIDIYLPSNYENDINISVKTGNVKADEQVKNIRSVKSTTGNITLNEVTDANVKATTGNIKINSIINSNVKTTTGNISVKYSSDTLYRCSTGNIKITNVLNYVDAKVSTGNIIIENLTLYRDSVIQTTTGNIKVNNVNDIYVEASTKTGNIKTSYSNRLAEYILTLKTSTGNITTGELITE